MALASSVTRSGITSFARYRNVKAGYVPQPVVTGGYLTQDSTYYYRTFVSSSNLVITGGSLVVDFLVVGGGGGGGRANGAGGGAGGYIAVAGTTLTSNSYPVVIGAGGPGMVASQSSSSTGTGGNSTFNSQTANGGGGAGGYNASGVPLAGSGGASGGGSWSNAAAGAGIAGQGNSGAGGVANGSYYSETAGGGGGAGGAGSAGSSSASGAGGVGLQWVNGSYYAGGGGGGSPSQGSAANGFGAGGTGGGGRGGQSNQPIDGTNGTPNTGGGGGGGTYTGTMTALGVAGNGGSGVVIVRYLKTSALSSGSWQTDSSSASLKLAMPLSADLGFNDYSASISGSGSNRVMSAVNTPTFSNVASKFYGTSLDMGVYTDNKYVNTPTNANLQIGTNDFTIEGWYYLKANNVGYQCLASHAGDTGDSQPGWALILESNNTLAFYTATSAGGWSSNLTTSTTPTASAWHHIAVSRSGGTMRMFLDGTQVVSVASTSNIGVPASQSLRVGQYNWFPGGARGLSGYVQDFRFYIGVGKYTSAFTPPSQIYVGG